MKKDIISVSDSAIDKIKYLMDNRSEPPAGLRVSLKTKGCSGLSWSLDFIDDISRSDEHMVTEGIDIYIDPKAVLFVLGSTIDYISSELEEGFIFTNPNEKGKCGCGESFTV